MITHIQVTTVFVRDQDKALDFYTNKLGFNLKTDQLMGENFRWVEVVPPEGEATISLSAPFPGMPDSAIGGSTGMIFNTNDMAKTHKALKDKGVTFTEEPKEQPWGGIQAQIADPDGNVFMLVQRTDQ